MNTPQKLNWEGLKKWHEDRTASVPTPVRPVRVIAHTQLVKVGGLYRIRDDYESVWKLEAGEDGKQYVIRMGEGPEERLLISESVEEEAFAKAALTIKAEESDPADEPGGKLQQSGTKKCRDCGTKMSGSSVLSNCPDCADKKGSTTAIFKTIKNGVVHHLWECARCDTPNITKEGNAYECDSCHEKFSSYKEADNDLSNQVYDRAAAAEQFGFEVAARMQAEGLSRAKGDLLEIWAKEVNPWAVCHTTVDQESNPEKYERCVKDVKKKNHVSQ